MRIVLLALMLTASTTAAQSPPADPPVLSERDQLVLAVLHLQTQIANLRLEKAASDLKRPGWRVDLVGGQWRYVAEVTP